MSAMVGQKVHWQKGSYDNIVSAIDIIFDQWDQSTVTPMEEERAAKIGNFFNTIS